MNKNQPSSQEVGSQSKPLLVKIIAGIALFIGVSGIFAWVMFILPGPIGVSDVVEITLVISIAFIVGGLGLFYMKKWGLYAFSIAALISIIDTLSEVWPVWEMWRWFGMGAVILVLFYMIYGVGSLIYLWSIRSHFK